MSELSERIRRNMTDNLEGWMKRLMKEAADDIDRLEAELEKMRRERGVRVTSN